MHFPARYYVIAILLIVSSLYLRAQTLLIRVSPDLVRILSSCQWSVLIPSASIHYLFGLWQSNSRPKINFSSLVDKWKLSEHSQPVLPRPTLDAEELETSAIVQEPVGPPRVNATFVILVRNNELKDIVDSIKQMEDRFNRQYHYPYVFLNDVPFNEEFKRHVYLV